MNQAAEQIARQFANANMNKRTWDGLLYNVKVYGASGDGKTDDTRAIQKTIDAAEDAGGGIVYFPYGEYVVTSLTVNGNMTFASSGSTLRFKDGLSDRTVMFQITANGIDVRFENIIFDGNTDKITRPDSENPISYRFISWELHSNPTVSGRNSFLTVEGCRFLNTPSNAIFLTGYKDLEHSGGEDAAVFRIVGNYFEKGYENEPWQLDTSIIAISGNCNGEIEGNTFIKHDPITLYGLAAIVISTADTNVEVFSTVTIRDNYFEGYGRQGTDGIGPLGVIDFYASCKYLLIEGNKFVNSFNTSIKGKTNSEQVIIKGNVIEGYTSTANTTNKSYGIIIGRGTYFGIYDKFIVSENVINGIPGTGIDIAGAGSSFTPSGNVKDVIVTYNEVEVIKEEGITSYGIYIFNVENAVVKGNILKNNTTGIYVSNYKKEFVINDNQIFDCDQYFIAFVGFATGESGYVDFDANVVVKGNTMRTTIASGYTTFRCLYFERLNNVVAIGNIAKIEGSTAPQNFLRTGAETKGLVTAHHNILDGIAAVGFFGIVSGTLVQSNNYNNKSVVT